MSAGILLGVRGVVPFGAQTPQVGYFYGKISKKYWSTPDGSSGPVIMAQIGQNDQNMQKCPIYGAHMGA